MAREMFVARPSDASVRRLPARTVILVAGAFLAVASLGVFLSVDRSQPGDSGPAGAVTDQAANSGEPSSVTTGSTDADTNDDGTIRVVPDLSDRGTDGKGDRVQGAEDPTDETSADPGRNMGDGPAESASEAVLGLLRATEVVLRGDADPTDASVYASGAALSEVEAAAAEFASVGWRQEGEVTVVEIEELDQVTDRGTVVVEACIDSSRLAVMDAYGNVVRATVASGERRSLQWFEVDRVSAGFEVVRVGFPDDADC